MITITRRLARRVRAVFRKALKITRGVGPPICFHASSEGLRIHSQTDEVAVEYYETGEFPAESLRLPLEFLNDFTTGRDGPVELEVASNNQAEVRWSEHGVPRTVRFDVPGLSPENPPRPERMMEQDPRFMSALKEGSATCDPLATRLAFGCVELCGETGEITATDGHQLLIQRGFAFPWNDKGLIRANPVWDSSELVGTDPVSVGRTSEAVVVTVGPWSIWLKLVKDARFPNVRDHSPSIETVVTSLELTEEDAQFLADRLMGLPSGESKSQPVTLDLNGKVAIRAKAEDQSAPTELVLAGSRYQGQPIVINTNRHFLARALALGFRDVHFEGAENPAHCQDAHRHYVWAVLEKDGVIKPSKQCVRIESGPASENATRQTDPKENHPQMTVNRISQPKNRVDDQPKPHTAAETVSIDSLIETAETVRTCLRDSMSRLSKLIAALKQHRKQSKTLHSALLSIRALQGIES